MKVWNAGNTVAILFFKPRTANFRQDGNHCLWHGAVYLVHCDIIRRITFVYW
jgi:hypothetical protein